MKVNALVSVVSLMVTLCKGPFGNHMGQPPENARRDLLGLFEGYAEAKDSKLTIRRFRDVGRGLTVECLV